jgi:hypothetical protein
MLHGMLRPLFALVMLASSASAAPFRWQADDGTRVEAEVVAEPGKPPRLEVTKPAPATIELAGAEVGDTLRLDALRDELVLVGSARAWRLAWKKGRLDPVASARWRTPNRRPAWASPRTITSYYVAFEEMRQLMRFEGTRPGLERFFGDAEVTVTYGGGTRASEKLPGRELLARWQREGFPLARGTIKTGVPRCGTLPINYAGYDEVPAADPDGPRLFMACFAKDLQVTSLTLTIPK